MRTWRACIKQDKHWFQCRDCGNYPDCVVVDGVVIGPRLEQAVCLDLKRIAERANII